MASQSERIGKVEAAIESLAATQAAMLELLKGATATAPATAPAIAEAATATEVVASGVCDGKRKVAGKGDGGHRKGVAWSVVRIGTCGKAGMLHKTCGGRGCGGAMREYRGCGGCCKAAMAEFYASRRASK